MGQRIWVVDDSAADRLLTRLVLERSGVGDEIVDFDSATSALASLDDPSAAWPTLILLDLQMPGVGGLDFLDELERHAEAPPVHVAMLTSSTDEGDRERALSHACVRAYLAKPLQACAARSLAALIR